MRSEAGRRQKPEAENQNSVPTKSPSNLNDRSLAPPLAAGDDFGKELVNWLFPAYVTLIVLSIFLLKARSSMAQGNEMPFDRAVLTAVNTATLCGFPQSVGPNLLKGAAPYVLLLLTIAGSLFSLIVGGLAVRRILRLRYTDRQVLVAAGIAEILALAIGAAGGCGMGLGGGEGAPQFLTGLSQGACAFGNSGMMLGGPFAAAAWQTHAIVLPVIVLGGLGITVLMELFDLFFHGKALSPHARTVLAWTVGLYVVGVAGFTLLQWLSAPETLPIGPRFAQVLASDSVASINSRTAGISFEPIYTYPRAMMWAVILFMAIGASPGGTGGGLKTTTLHALFAGARRALRGQNPGRTFGLAMAWLGIYLGVALVGLILLLIAEPQMLGDQVFFLAVSALSNVGLSHDVLSISAKGSYILSALMLAGRMAPLLVLWWMADSTSDAELAIG